MKFAGASLLGFGVDALLLHIGMGAGLTPALARALSLLCAMQVTFLINSLLVFRCLDLSRPWRQWATYMASHGFGNFCSYWIFVTLVSTHWLIVSAPLVALTLGAALAWLINYCGARLLVFPKVFDKVRPALRPSGDFAPPET